MHVHAPSQVAQSARQIHLSALHSEAKHVSNDGSGDFGESSHSGVSGDWYSMVFYSPELH